MPERRFLKFFYFFFEFLWESSNIGWAETVPRMIFYFLFFGQSRSGLAINEAKMFIYLFL